MKIRRVNQQLLRLLIFQAGGYKAAAEKTGVSKTLLSGLVNGTYKRDVKEKTRIEICLGFGAEEDKLFAPIAVGGEKAS